MQNDVSNQNPTLLITADGSHSLFSHHLGASYHSKHGAIQETQHVFIDAALKYKATQQNSLSILDIGFGTGLNAYMTFLEAVKLNVQIDYVAVEAYPITLDLAQQLNYPQLLNDQTSPNVLIQMHAAEWSKKINLSTNFSFEKLALKFESLNFSNQFDIIYFDAFAPSVQENLWENKLLQAMHKALKENGVWVSYCAKGVVKRTLKAIGFEIEAIKGPPGKREMTRAIKHQHE